MNDRKGSIVDDESKCKLCYSNESTIKQLTKERDSLKMDVSNRDFALKKKESTLQQYALIIQQQKLEITALKSRLSQFKFMPYVTMNGKNAAIPSSSNGSMPSSKSDKEKHSSSQTALNMPFEQGQESLKKHGHPEQLNTPKKKDPRSTPNSVEQSDSILLLIDSLQLPNEVDKNGGDLDRSNFILDSEGLKDQDGSDQTPLSNHSRTSWQGENASVNIGRPSSSGEQQVGSTLNASNRTAIPKKPVVLNQTEVIEESESSFQSDQNQPTQFKERDDKTRSNLLTTLLDKHQSQTQISSKSNKMMTGSRFASLSYSFQRMKTEETPQSNLISSGKGVKKSSNNKNAYLPINLENPNTTITPFPLLKEQKQAKLAGNTQSSLVQHQNQSIINDNQKGKQIKSKSSVDLNNNQQKLKGFDKQMESTIGSFQRQSNMIQNQNADAEIGHPMQQQIDNHPNPQEQLFLNQFFQNNDHQNSISSIGSLSRQEFYKKQKIMQIKKEEAKKGSSLSSFQISKSKLTEKNMSPSPNKIDRSASQINKKQAKKTIDNIYGFRIRSRSANHVDQKLFCQGVTSIQQ